MNKGHKPKAKEGNGQEQLQPNEAPSPPPSPPPQEESLPPPPVSEEAPKPHKQGKDKFNKGHGEQMQPGQQMLPPPPPPQDETAPPPPSPSGDAPPDANKRDGKGKHRKDNGKAPCPEGAVQLDDGSCVVPQ